MYLPWKYFACFYGVFFRPITSVASVHVFSAGVTGNAVTGSDATQFNITGSDVTAPYKLKEKEEEGRRRRRRKRRGARGGGRGEREKERKKGKEAGGREEGGRQWGFPSSTVAPHPLPLPYSAPTPSLGKWP